jgi:hypothetical protein
MIQEIERISEGKEGKRGGSFFAEILSVYDLTKGDKTMNLKPLAANKTEMTFTKEDGSTYRVLFSYQTPVAYIRTWPDGGMVIRKTNKRWSNTTTRHINSWIPTNHLAIDQSEFDNLLKGVK